MIKLLFDGANAPDEILSLAMQQLAQAEVPDWEKAHWQTVVDWLSPNATIEVHTSGSTGAPKALLLSKQSVRSSALITAHYFHLPQGTTAWLVLPSAYIAGKMMVIRALVNGWKLFASEPHLALPAVSMAIDFAAFTPAQMESLLNGEREDWKNLGTVILGGGVISEALIERMSTISTRVVGTYGMAETITHIAVRALNGPHAQSAFQALPGVQFSADERGCLVVHAAHLDEPVVVTNDVVELIDAHAFRFVTRFDNVVVSGGVKLYPEEIEAAVADLMHAPFYVSGLADDVLGRKLVVFVEATPFDTTALLQEWRERVGGVKTPKEVRFVPRFERTTSGKVKRQKD